MKDINFKYFRCLEYMDQMSSCLLEGYGVLPSYPVNFRFSNVDTTFAILHWEKPEILGETVRNYKVTYQVGVNVWSKPVSFVTTMFSPGYGSRGRREENYPCSSQSVYS